MTEKLEPMVEQMALALAAAHDHASDSPTKAVTAYKAGVGFCQDYWDCLAMAALEASSHRPILEALEEAAKIVLLLRSSAKASVGGNLAPGFEMACDEVVVAIRALALSKGRVSG